MLLASVDSVGPDVGRRLSFTAIGGRLVGRRGINIVCPFTCLSSFPLDPGTVVCLGAVHRIAATVAGSVRSSLLSDVRPGDTLCDSGDVRTTQFARAL